MAATIKQGSLQLKQTGQDKYKTDIFNLLWADCSFFWPLFIHRWNL